MSHEEENQKAIQEYLKDQFKGFEVTERPEHPLYHWFTVTILKPPAKQSEQYKLRVAWPKISDHNNSPEKIARQLVLDEVANRMRAKPQGDYLSWGLG